MIPSHVQGLIVGAGPAGLAVALGLQGDTLVVEKEAAVGGLCRSIHHGGGTFDLGGHSFHTPDPAILDLVSGLLPGGLYTQRREAWVYSHGALIPYPFQQHFDRLPDPGVVEACARGLRERPGQPATPRHLPEYLVSTFGTGIAEHFLLPYNRKLWGPDLDRLSCDWVGQRVAPAGDDHLTLGPAPRTRRPLMSGTEVGYPPAGGFDEILKALVPRLPGVALNTTLVHIDPLRRLAVMAGGQVVRWQFLVSTMALPELLAIIDGVPLQVRSLALCLEYVSLRVEMLLVGRRLATPIQRVYSADSAVGPHKIALNHNSSPFLRQRPVHAITAEIARRAEGPGEPEPRIATSDLLCRIGILDSPADVTWQAHLDLTYAYPVHTAERPALVTEIKGWLQQHEIYVVGRFGDWEYLNADACLARGLALAADLRRRYPAPKEH